MFISLVIIFGVLILGNLLLSFIQKTITDNKFNFEDKDMTNLFFELNAERMEKYKIGYILNDQWFQRGFNTSVNVLSDLSLTEAFDKSIEYQAIHFDCYSNNFFEISLNNKTLKFFDKDIKNHGKEWLFNRATECINTSYLII